MAKCKVISVVQHKGGTGKTSLATNLACILSLRGFRVLFIDADAQANATVALGLMEFEDDLSSFLSNGSGKMSRKQGIDIIAGSLNSVELEHTLRTKEAAGESSDSVISDLIQKVAKKGKYDYCIIDTAPALGGLLASCICAAHWVLCPTMPDTFGLQGLSRVRQIVEAAVKAKKKNGPNTKGYRVILNRVPRSNIGKMTAEAIRNAFDCFKTELRQDVAVQEASALQKPVAEHKPKSNAAEDYNSVTDEILELVG